MNAENFACDYRAFRLYQSLYVVVLLFFVISPTASQLLNLPIPLTSPSLVYTPFVCNATEVSLNPAVCEGGWKMSSDNTEVSTTGSSKAILPQIFLRFRASGVYIKTSPDSNATVEITVAWETIMRKSNFDSSMGFIGIMDLPDNSTFLLTITVNPSTSPTLFGMTSVEVAAPPDAPLTSVLPPAITLSPATPTVFVPQSTSSNPSTTTIPSGSGSQKLSPRTVKLAIGLSVGLGLGLTLLAAIFYWLFRRHRNFLRKDGGRWSFVT